MTQLSERPPGSLDDTRWLVDTRRPVDRPRHAASRAGVPVRLVVLALLAAAVTGGAAGGVAGSLTSRTRTPSATPSPVGSAQVSGAPGDLPVVIARASKSVVDIEASTTTYDARGRPTVESSAGSGFVYDTDGLVATNAHVVADADHVAVTLADGSTVRGEVLGRDLTEDLAVVRIDKDGLIALPLGRSSTVRVGDFVIAAGNALALEGSPTITIGIVSALGRSITTSTGTELSGLIQTDAAISSGDSGGPLLTPAGQVIGINTAGAAGTAGVLVTNIGFAIPTDRAASVLDELSGE